MRIILYFTKLKTNYLTRRGFLPDGQSIGKCRQTIYFFFLCFVHVPQKTNIINDYERRIERERGKERAPKIQHATFNIPVASKPPPVGHKYI